MIADAKYSIPLAQHITTGRRNDFPEFPPLIDQAKRSINRFAPKVAIAGQGYDSAANHQVLWFKRGIIPVIHIRKPSNTSLYQGIHTKEGIPTCLGMVPMEYIGTNKNGHHMYRCRQERCNLKDSPNEGIRHRDTFYLQGENCVTHPTRRQHPAPSAHPLGDS